MDAIKKIEAAFDQWYDSQRSPGAAESVKRSCGAGAVEYFAARDAWMACGSCFERITAQTLASNAAEVQRLREALKFAIEVIEDLDGKDNSCDPKCGTAELRAALTNQQPTAE